MKLILVAVACCFQIFSIRTVNSSNVSESELLMAKVIFRNGKQPPPEKAELDKFLLERLKFEVEPFDVKKLTEEGKVDMYNFGAKIRRWYESRFSQNKPEIKNKIEVQSTSHEGCRKSAKFVKNGVLGNEFKKKYQDSVKNSSLDSLLEFLYKEDGCKSLYNMNGVPYKPIDFKFVFDTRNKLVEKLKINLYPQGPYVHNSPDLHPIKAQHLWKIYEYYEALRYSNETLPDWLTENMIFDMEESNKLLMKVLFEWNYLKQASGGAVYANTILEEFQNKMKNFQSLDIQLLCAQEIVVTTAVSALINSKSKICDKTFEPGVVKHGTALITELYKNKKKSEYFVKVFYWNPNQDEPKQIKYDECKGECTFEKFKEFLKNSAISESKLRDSALCKTK